MSGTTVLRAREAGLLAHLATTTVVARPQNVVPAGPTRHRESPRGDHPGHLRGPPLLSGVLLLTVTGWIAGLLTWLRAAHHTGHP